MNNNKKLRLRLFPGIAADLKRRRPDLAGKVLCPLCLNPYDKEDCEKGVLTAEHIISGLLGGDSYTLTCTKSNNGDGSELDSQLVAAMKALDGREGLDFVPGSFQNEAGRVAVEVKLSPPGAKSPIELRVVGRASNPLVVRNLSNFIRDGGTANVTLRYRVIPRRYWRAVIRSGYLAIFQRFGYEYVFSRGAEQVRKVLDGAEPDARTIVQAWPSRKLSSLLLICPVQLDVSFYVVVLRLQSVATRYLAVFLPGDDGCDWDILGRVASLDRIRISTTPEGEAEMHIDVGRDPLQSLYTMPFHN